MLEEYGMQFGRAFYRPDRFWFGVTIASAESDLIGKEMLDNYKWKLNKAKEQGNDWVRIIFADNREGEDFTFSNKETFEKYNKAINYARSIGLNVMGQILDSASWPKDITVEKYRLRTHNIVTHYKNIIPAWEIGNEINGNWLGGKRCAIPDYLIVDSVNAAAADVKNINSSLITVNTLYWWEGTANDNKHPLFLWINKWKKEKDFGKNIDIIALSMYPRENPVGSAFDIIIQKVHEEFPDKKLMIGEFGYSTNQKIGYRWHDNNAERAQKDLVQQYYIAMMGYNYSINGGFWWSFYDEMVKDDKETDLYGVYKKVILSFTADIPYPVMSQIH